MPKLVGNARQLIDARKMVRVLATLCLLFAATGPPQLAIVVPLLFEAVARLQGLRKRSPQTWPEHLNKYELVFDEESAIPHHFATFYCMSPGDFLQLHEALGVPDIMHTLCNKKFTGQTGLLVLIWHHRQQ